MESKSTTSSDAHSPRALLIVAAIMLLIGMLSLPTPAGMSIAAHRLAAITAVMALLWLTQPVSIAVTSLIPIAFYPFLGILDAQGVSEAYANHNVFLYLGGFTIAVAIERCGLHRRMALHIISRIGGNPKQIVFGFMVAAALLSMWISNTATAMMMLPIALALMSTLRDAVAKTDDNADELINRLSIPVLLGIAYACSIGGLSTFVGTPTNVSFRGYWDQNIVPRGYSSISMAEWIACFAPVSLGLLIVGGLIMTWGLPKLPHADRYSSSFFREQLRALGRASKTERRVFSIFMMTAFLWVTRKPLQFETTTILPDWPGLIVAAARSIGWDLAFLKTMVQDSTIGMAMASLLFIIPGESNNEGEYEPIMTWEAAERALPWGMILLIGSGFAMAAAFSETELADWLGQSFAQLFAGQSNTVLVLGTCLMVTFLTEFTTNVATVNTLLPTLDAMATQLAIHPKMLLIPATVSASCAFMLPIATPPNAIIFGSNKVPLQAMLKYGVLLNLIGVLFVTAASLLLMPLILQVS